MRRRTVWDDIFESEAHNLQQTSNQLRRDRTRRPDIVEMQPTPYHYGLVGANIRAETVSPPGSPNMHYRHGPDSPQGSFSLAPGATLAPQGYGHIRPTTASSRNSSGRLSSSSQQPLLDNYYGRAPSASSPPLPSVPMPHYADQPYIPPVPPVPPIHQAASSPHAALPPGARAPTVSAQVAKPGVNYPVPLLIPVASAPSTPSTSTQQAATSPTMPVMRHNASGKLVMSASASARPEVIVHQDAGRVPTAGMAEGVQDPEPASDAPPAYSRD